MTPNIRCPGACWPVGRAAGAGAISARAGAGDPGRSLADQRRYPAEDLAFDGGCVRPGEETNAANASRPDARTSTHLSGARTSRSRREVTAHAAIGDERERRGAVEHLDDDYEVAAPGGADIASGLPRG